VCRIARFDRSGIVLLPPPISPDLDMPFRKPNLHDVNVRILFSAVAVPLLLTQCGPEAMLNPTREVNHQPVIPKGPETAFVNDVSGSRIVYNDNHGENTYRLKKTHLYQFASLSWNRKSTDTRTGVWLYKKTGTKTGVLTFDANDVWHLKFVSRNRAIAKNDGDVRSYTFNFEWE
jgi:hypothetical protein